MEDATAGVAPAFQPVYHAKETTVNTTNGILNYSRTVGGVGNTALDNLFDGGGGTAFFVPISAVMTQLAKGTYLGPIPGYLTYTGLYLGKSSIPSAPSGDFVVMHNPGNFTALNAPSGETLYLETNAGATGMYASLTATAFSIVGGPLVLSSTLTPASATTAGVTGQIAWQGTNGTTGQIFICTSGGTASNAIWMAAALTKV
jgi:hypothetical protein